MVGRLYLYAALAATALVAGGWWHLSRVKAAEKAVHAHYAVVLADIKDKTAAAAEAFRAQERVWQTKVDEVAKDGQKQLDIARRDAADAGRAADGLRDALNRYRAAARAAQDTGAAGARESVTGGDPLDLLAGLLARHSSELVEVGAYADALRAAGVTCERVVDAVGSGAD